MKISPKILPYSEKGGVFQLHHVHAQHPRRLIGSRSQYPLSSIEFYDAYCVCHRRM